MVNYMIMEKKMKNSFKSYTYSGTMSFALIIQSLKLDINDEIIVPVTLCQSIIDVIVKKRLKPIFVDIDDNFIINKSIIDKNITKKTKVILFVEQYGNIIVDNNDYYNLNGERIVKVLDSCQNGIKKYKNNNYDYVFYSFNHRKPIDLNGYSMIISNNKIETNIRMPLKKRIVFNYKKILYKLNLCKKIYIKNVISKKIIIPGHIVQCKNYSYHRIIYVADISKMVFLKLEDSIYDYMQKNNYDVVQTTIEIAPYEKLNVKKRFPNYERLKYQTLFFRSNNRIKEYNNIIKYLNEIYKELL